MILVFADEIWPTWRLGSELACGLPNRGGVDALLKAATTAGIVAAVDDDEDAESRGTV